MQNKVILTVAVTVGLIAGAGMIWVWKISQPNAGNAAAVPTSTKSATGSSISLSQDSAPLTLGVSSGDALSDPSLVAGGTNNQGLGGGSTASGSGQAQASSTSSTGSSQGDSATTDPSKFSMYDKYKSQESALFADLTKGSGKEAGANSKVSVNYRGWLTNGQLFDQNTDSAKPFTFTIGAHNVIPGWEQTIYGMKVGGERLLIIPPAAGYGAAGQGPIPGNAVLVFYVKLLAVE